MHGMRLPTIFEYWGEEYLVEKSPPPPQENHLFLREEEGRPFW